MRMLTSVPILGIFVPNMGTMRSKSSETTLFGKTRSGILSLLFGQPQESFYLRQVVGLVGTGVGATQRELMSLRKLGIIESEKKGNQLHFRANPRSPIYDDLQNIIRKMDDWISVLKAALKPMETDIEMAFVYGSYASHTQTAVSDVDLWVMGNVDEMALHRAVLGVEKKIAKTINYTVMAPKEYAKRARERGGFISRILKGPKIMLIGDPHEI